MKVIPSTNMLGLTYFYLQKFDLSYSYYQQTLEIEEELYGPNDFKIYNSITNVGVALEAIKDYEKDFRCTKRRREKII